MKFQKRVEEPCGDIGRLGRLEYLQSSQLLADAR